MLSSHVLYLLLELKLQQQPFEVLLLFLYCSSPNEFEVYLNGHTPSATSYKDCSIRIHELAPFAAVISTFACLII